MPVERNQSLKYLVITTPKGIRDTAAQLLSEDNIDITFAKWNDITAIFSSSGVSMLCKGKSITHYDFVWIMSAGLTKDIAYMLSLYLDSVGIPHTQPEFETTKVVDLFTLCNNKLPIPKTYFTARKKILGNLQRFEKELGYPFVIKSTVGWGGNDVYIIENSADFFKIVPDLSTKKKYTCQKFIPNSFDYRVIIGNGVVLSGEKRIRQSDAFRNNASLGAEEVFLDLKKIPPEVKRLAIRAAAVCNLSWAGIDIVTNNKTGKHYILEINRRPGLTQKTSEIEAALTFLKEIKEKMIAKRASAG